MRKIGQGEGSRHFKQRDSEAGNSTAPKEIQVLTYGRSKGHI